MKSIIPMGLLWVSIAALAFILMLTPLTPPAGLAASKTVTKSTADPPGKTTTTVTPTATQQMRKVKLFPGTYAGPVHIKVENDDNAPDQPPNNFVHWNWQWTLDGTITITVAREGSAKARLVFNQIDGSELDDFLDTEPDTGFVCHSTSSAAGHITAMTQTVVFNPDDGSFTIPFEIFNINTYGTYAHNEGPHCGNNETTLMDIRARAMKDSSLALSPIDFSVDSVEPASMGVGNNQNCAMTAVADAAKRDPSTTESCHWQVYKLTNKSKGWKK